MLNLSDVGRFRARLREETCFGTFATLGSAAAAEFVAASGVDFVVIDAQHGLGGPTDLSGSLQAMARYDAACLVRVPVNDDAAVERALDAGAHGVIVPGVESGAQAARAVAHCKYPPLGVRSFGPIRSDLQFGLDPTVANEHTLCFVMIENRAGLAAREEICATPGIDGIFIGPTDLAVSLGLTPSLKAIPGEHADAIAQINAAARANDLVVGIHAGTGASARDWAGHGFTFVTVSSDAGLLRWAVSKSMRDARAT